LTHTHTHTAPSHVHPQAHFHAHRHLPTKPGHRIAFFVRLCLIGGPCSDERGSLGSIPPPLISRCCALQRIWPSTAIPRRPALTVIPRVNFQPAASCVLHRQHLRCAFCLEGLRALYSSTLQETDGRLKSQNAPPFCFLFQRIYRRLRAKWPESDRLDQKNTANSLPVASGPSNSPLQCL